MQHRSRHIVLSFVAVRQTAQACLHWDRAWLRVFAAGSSVIFTPDSPDSYTTCQPLPFPNVTTERATRTVAHPRTVTSVSSLLRSNLSTLMPCARVAPCLSLKPGIFGYVRSLLANLPEKQRLQNKGSLIVLLGSPLPTAAPTPRPTERLPLTLRPAQHSVHGQQATSAVLVTLRRYLQLEQAALLPSRLRNPNLFDCGRSTLPRTATPSASAAPITPGPKGTSLALIIGASVSGSVLVAAAAVAAIRLRKSRADGLRTNLLGPG